MNLYQCQEKAKDIGFDKARFFAMFPRGLVLCIWLDAYMGLFTMDIEGMDNGFVTVKQIDEQYPDLECSDLWIEEEDE